MDYLIIYGMTIILLSGCIWWNWGIVKLNSHSLHLQWLFWIAIIFPIYSCFYFGVIVWIEYPVEVSKKGYSDFLDISKLPLYLLAGSPILGAFVASAHRSFQTDIQIKKTQRQIELTEEKNNIDMIISRIKFTDERLANLKLLNKYKLAYPDSVIFSFFEICNGEIAPNYLSKQVDMVVFKIIELKKYIELTVDELTKSLNEGCIDVLKNTDALNDSINEIVKKVNNIDVLIVSTMRKVGFKILDDDKTLVAFDIHLIDLCRSGDVELILEGLNSIKTRNYIVVDLFLFVLNNFFNVISFVDNTIKNNLPSLNDYIKDSI